MTRGRPKRKGLSLLPAMVCLVVITMLCGVMLRQAKTRRDVVRAEERRMQVEWLVESGLSRASAKLTGDHGYQGEAWDVSAEALGGGGSGARVTIAVDGVEGQTGRRRVRVVAEMPREGEARDKQTKQVILELGPDKPGGSS